VKTRENKLMRFRNCRFIFLVAATRGTACYTRAENPHSNLFNKQGLPASAFRYRALARQHSAKIADLIETKVFVFGADKVTE
jgi:hypothetical protein